VPEVEVRTFSIFLVTLPQCPRDIQSPQIGLLDALPHLHHLVSSPPSSSSSISEDLCLSLVSVQHESPPSFLTRGRLIQPPHTVKCFLKTTQFPTLSLKTLWLALILQIFLGLSFPADQSVPVTSFPPSVQLLVHSGHLVNTTVCVTHATSPSVTDI
jgi:hypothetical protein